MRPMGVAPDGEAGAPRVNPYHIQKREADSEGPLGSHTRPFIGRDLTELSALALDAHVVLEAFGHAKTLANDNSSRVGKHTKIFLTPEGTGDDQP